MPRMLTEEEVKKLEQQRGLQERKAAAIAGMTDNERIRFREAEEREMWDRRFRETHGGLSRAEVAAAGPNGSGRQYAAIRRGFELQRARDHELEMQAKELATRRQESEDRKLGMIGQGRDAAKLKGEAEVRAEEMRTASAERIADINKNRDVEITGMTTKSNEAINKDKNDAAVEMTEKQGKSTVEAERVKAAEAEAQRMHETLRREREMDEREQQEAMEILRKRAERIMKEEMMRGKRISPEEAMKAAKAYEERWNTLPGRKIDKFRQ